MEKTLEYVIQRFENDYYKNNLELLKCGHNCMQKEGLACNCITGIMLNYAGYVIRNCFVDDTYVVKCVEKDGVMYVQTSQDDKILIPVINDYDSVSDYLLGERMCMDSSSDSNQAYITFGTYNEIQDIINQMEKLKQNELCVLGHEKSYYFEFWIRFLSALRVQKIEISHRAFLFMAVFTFPNRTLKLMIDLIKKNSGKAESVASFLCDYLTFLCDIEDPEQGFLFKFCQAYNKATNINVAEFVEVAQQNELGQMGDVLYTAYRHNLSEIRRRSGGFKTIVKITNSLTDTVKSDAVKKLSEMVDSIRETFVEDSNDKNKQLN